MRRAFREELNIGQSELTELVGNALLNAALGQKPTSGEPIKSDAARVNAMTFFLECRQVGSEGCSFKRGNATSTDGNTIPFVYQANKPDAGE